MSDGSIRRQLSVFFLLWLLRPHNANCQVFFAKETLRHITTRALQHTAHVNRNMQHSVSLSWRESHVSHVTRDSFMCDITDSNVTCLIYMWYYWFICDMTDSYVMWLIYMWHYEPWHLRPHKHVLLVAVYYSVLHLVAACCSLLQLVAACCSVLQCVEMYYSVSQCVVACCSSHMTFEAWDCVAVFFSVL